MDLEENLEGLIPYVSNDRNYWLVRTHGGDYYGEFLAGNYIGIDWNYLNNIKVIKDIDGTEKIIELIKEKYPEEKRPNHALRQIRQFTSEMKKGDIIIVPSTSSQYVSFGEVLEDEIYLENLNEDEIDEGVCPFMKRRRVKWIKTQDREELDLYLYKLLYSHHTITNAKDYETAIDRTLNQFYIKDGNAHFIMKVNEARNIKAVELYNLINNNLSLIDKFNTKYNETLNINNIDIKINVQSPGPVEIYGSMKEIIVIGIAIIGICGGGFKFKDIEIKTDGFIKKIIELFDHQHTNKMDEIEMQIKLSQEKLKLEVPKIDNLISYSLSENATAVENEDIKSEQKKE